MKKSIVNLFLMFMVIVSFYACVPSKPVYEEKTATYDRLVKKIEINKRRIKSFYGIGAINVFSSSESLKANFEVYMKRPDSLKIVVYGPLGIDLAQILITKSNFRFYDVMQNVLYTGKLNSDILKRIIKMNISFEDLYESFTGAMSLSDKLTMQPTILNSAAGNLDVIFADSAGGRKTTYTVNAEDLSILNYRTATLAGRDILIGNYFDYKITDEIAVPMRINLEYKETKEKLIIEYRNYEVNKNIQSLSITLPDDVKIVKW